MIAGASALALIPEEVKSEDAAPLVCAGITTFNALCNTGRAGDTVSIQGIGVVWGISGCNTPKRWASAPLREFVSNPIVARLNVTICPAYLFAAHAAPIIQSPGTSSHHDLAHLSCQKLQS